MISLFCSSGVWEWLNWVLSLGLFTDLQSLSGGATFFPGAWWSLLGICACWQDLLPCFWAGRVPVSCWWLVTALSLLTSQSFFPREPLINPFIIWQPVQRQQETLLPQREKSLLIWSCISHNIVMRMTSCHLCHLWLEANHRFCPDSRAEAGPGLQLIWVHQRECLSYWVPAKATSQRGWKQRWRNSS